jgi:hypothetical protein
VQRKTRHGQDRAYVCLDDVLIGYRDLETGAVCCEHSEHVDLVRRCTEKLLPRRAHAYIPRHAGG